VLIYTVSIREHFFANRTLLVVDPVANFLMVLQGLFTGQNLVTFAARVSYSVVLCIVRLGYHVFLNRGDTLLNWGDIFLNNGDTFLNYTTRISIR